MESEETIVKYRKNRGSYFEALEGRHGPAAIARDLVERAKKPELNKDNPRVVHTPDDATYYPFGADKQRKPERDERQHFMDIALLTESGNGKDPKKDAQYKPYENAYQAYKRAKEIVVYGAKKAKEKAKSIYSAANNVAAALERRLDRYFRKSYKIDFKDDREGEEGNSNGLYEKVSGILSKPYSTVSEAVQYLKSLSYGERTARPDTPIYDGGDNGYAFDALAHYITGMGYFGAVANKASNDNYKLEEELQTQAPTQGLENVVSLEEARIIRIKRTGPILTDLQDAA